MLHSGPGDISGAALIARFIDTLPRIAHAALESTTYLLHLTPIVLLGLARRTPEVSMPTSRCDPEQRPRRIDEHASLPGNSPVVTCALRN